MSTPTNPRKPAVPYHVLDRAEPSRDAALKIQAEIQAMLDVAAEAAESENGDAWRALAKAVSHAGTINRLAALIVRELESIRGMDRPADADGLKLVEREA